MNQVLTPDELSRQGKERYDQEEYLESATLFNRAAEAYRAADDHFSKIVAGQDAVAGHPRQDLAGRAG